MSALITKNTLAKIKSKNKQYEIRDTRLKGFAIRVYKSGKAAYIVWYDRGKAATIGSVDVLTPAQARQQAIEILAEASKGNDPIEKKRQAKKESLTFKQFLDNEYNPWVTQNRKGGQATVEIIKRHFLPIYKDKKLTEITPWLVDLWRSKRLKAGIKHSSINRDITSLKAALSKAVEWNLIDTHPLAKLKQFRVDNKPNVRFLDVDEEKRLREALGAREERMRAERDSANVWRLERKYDLKPDLKEVAFVDHLKPIVLLSLNTGARRGELFNLKWQDIDFNLKIMTITGDGTKSGKTLHMPLNQEAYSVLWQWKKQSNGNGLVFPGKNGDKLDNVNKSWRALLKEAGITNFRWHDMRHHFASQLVMAGTELAVVRELLGHSDFTMTLRYSHLGETIKRQAVEKLVK